MVSCPFCRFLVVLGVFLGADPPGEGGSGREFGGGRVADLLKGQAVRRDHADGGVPDRCR